MAAPDCSKFIQAENWFGQLSNIKIIVPRLNVTRMLKPYYNKLIQAETDENVFGQIL